MSETVHYRGIATQIAPFDDKTALDVAKEILENKGVYIAECYDNAIDCLTEKFYNEYFFHHKTQKLYNITKTEHDLDDDIIKASLNEDGTIEYELRYYNGGAGFDECMEEAFDKLITI